MNASIFQLSFSHFCVILCYNYFEEFAGDRKALLMNR